MKLTTLGRIALIILGLCATPLLADEQRAGKGHRIGVLLHDGAPPGLLEAFREGLHERGYVEGQNAAIEVRNAAGQNERLCALADELLRLKVDVILAVNTPAAQAAKQATATIPIVITRIADPVQSGLVASLARPSGNITGLSLRYQAGRPARRAAHAVRAGHQPQDRASARPDHSPAYPLPGG